MFGVAIVEAARFKVQVQDTITENDDKHLLTWHGVRGVTVNIDHIVSRVLFEYLEAMSHQINNERGYTD